MVKQKAKAEMAQLERDLLSVIHAMEEANIGNNGAVFTQVFRVP
jgi:hypothetical protein